jgi:hypothetical protein
MGFGLITEKMTRMRIIVLLFCFCLTQMFFVRTATARDDSSKEDSVSREQLADRRKDLRAQQQQLQFELAALTNDLSTIQQVRIALTNSLFDTEAAQNSLADLSNAVAILDHLQPDTSLLQQSEEVVNLQNSLNSFEASLAALNSKIYALFPIGTPAPNQMQAPIEQYYSTLLRDSFALSDGSSAPQEDPIPHLNRLSNRLMSYGRVTKRSEIGTNVFYAVYVELSNDPVKKLHSAFDLRKEQLIQGAENAIKSLQQEMSGRQVQNTNINGDIAKIDKQVAALSNTQAVINQALVYTVYVVIIALVLIYYGLLYTKVEIARELITSRLVIELGTMAFLLLTIVILGLSEKLDKPSLGTLIGAIAGYLLARNKADINAQTQERPLPTMQLTKPTPLEIASLRSQPGGHFDLTYVAGGGLNATEVILQWKIDGQDANFAHDTPVIVAGQSISTNAPTGSTVRFKTLARNPQGQVECAEKSATTP